MVFTNPDIVRQLGALADARPEAAPLQGAGSSGAVACVGDGGATLPAGASAGCALPGPRSEPSPPGDAAAPTPLAPATSRAETVLLRLGELLHRHGLPADRLERVLTACAERLGVRVQLFCTPTSFFAAFGDSPRQTTHLVRVEPGEVDLGRLADLDAIVRDLGAGELGAREAEWRLAEAVLRPRRWGPLATVTAFGTASATSVVFLGGDGLDAALALVAGLALGVLAWLRCSRPSLARVFEPLAAAIAALLVGLGRPDGPRDVATVASLIVLVPGYTLTVAMTELASGHWAAGTSRMAGALVSFLSMGFGVALGSKVAGALGGWPGLPAPALPEGSLLLALLLAPLAFTVLFGARRRDAPLILVTCLLAYGGALLGGRVLGPGLEAFAGAALVGLASNLIASVAARPALVTLVPGIILLVPGSVGLRSVSSFLSDDTLAGVKTAFDVGFVAVALVAGLLMAHALLPPRRAL
jgi:uncharacterized membrane protein YjjP (DUF1212 family)